MLDKIRAMSQLRDVATDQQNAGTTATLIIDRDAAARFGIQPQQIDDTLYDAFGQRQVVQYFTQVNSYWVVLGVPPNLEATPPRSQPLRAVPLAARRCRSPPWSTSIHRAGDAAGGEPPEPIPGGDDQLQPGAGRLARPGGSDVHCLRAAGRAADVAGLVPGHRAGVPELAGQRAAT